MKAIYISFLLFLSAACQLAAQSPEPDRTKQYLQLHQQTWLQEYLTFVRIPNTPLNQTNQDLNSAFIIDMMRKTGIENIQLLKADVIGVPPAIYGEVNVPGAKRTIVFYAHYDGQPVDSTKWLPGWHPFRPLIIDGTPASGFKVITDIEKLNSLSPEWRITGRGSADDKAGVFAIIKAFQTLKELGQLPTVNLRFFFEGEEELGSTHLPNILTRHAALLKSDGWVICDGPEHPSGLPQLFLGVRGDAGMELTVYGSNRPLHSGHYGNWAPNPAHLLSHLLASMKDLDGKVLIQHFYDSITPLTAKEKTALLALPKMDEQLKKTFGFRRSEAPQRGLSASILQPSLNINGIQSAATGSGASNIIPSIATATLDLRLVPGIDFEVQQQRIEAHIRKQGYFITRDTPTTAQRNTYEKIIQVRRKSGYNAQKTPIYHPFAAGVIEALQLHTQQKLLVVPLMGGSLPLYMFEKYAAAYPITVPIANYDNNQHAENENLRLGNLWSGIEKMAALMRMKP
ncbi:MAG: M20/M25/M40 family metallo-hydrolase [Bacteroidota bacterium]|jgi:acetylornithine deacetylase/succinyl-diaminopimelate desuccinylase-like protein